MDMYPPESGDNEYFGVVEQMQDEDEVADMISERIADDLLTGGNQ